MRTNNFTYEPFYSNSILPPRIQEHDEYTGKIVTEIRDSLPLETELSDYEAILAEGH